MRSVVLLVLVMLVGCAEKSDFQYLPDEAPERDPYTEALNYPGLSQPTIAIWVSRTEMSPSLREELFSAVDHMNTIAGKEIFVFVPDWAMSNISVRGAEMDSGLYGNAFCSPGMCDVRINEATTTALLIREGTAAPVFEHELMHALGYKGTNETDPWHDADGLMGQQITQLEFTPRHIAFLASVR